jgi:mannose-6-phosphate isomerase-like protein (cupin superfamily)
MDIQAYIESGILQDYCLGVLSETEAQQVEQQAAIYPMIKKEIRSYQQALERYAIDFAPAMPPPGTKTRILDILDNLSKEKNTADGLPLLNRFSAREHWLRIVKPLIPEALEEDILVKVLRDDEQVFQTIVWIKNAYPDEVHDDIRECFMVLEGECECFAGDEVIRLGPGGFFDVPLHTHHDVKVINGPVLAVVQRLKIAS